jgi:hypothetical protein
MKPTSTWTCDHCRLPIEKLEDGWLEWLIPEKGKTCELPLRIVHNRGACCYRGRERVLASQGLQVQDMHLDAYTGPDGLILLLRILHEGHAPKDSVIEAIKRLHVPGYERARGQFKRAIEAGVFEANTTGGFYPMCDIEAVNAWLDSEGID